MKPNCISIDLISNTLCKLSKLTDEIIQKGELKNILTYVEQQNGHTIQIKYLSFVSKILRMLDMRLQQLPTCSTDILQYIARTKPISSNQIIQQLGPWILRPYQMAQIDFFFKRGGKIIIGDGWNMGKIVTTLSIISMTQLQLAIILCHPHQLYEWKVHILRSKVWQDELSIHPDKQIIEKGIILMSYEFFLKSKVKFKRLRLIVLDQPTHIEPSALQQIKTLENVIILSRFGKANFFKLFPLIMPNIREEFMKDRYGWEGNEKHQTEFKHVQSQFLIEHNHLSAKLINSIKPIYLQRSSSEDETLQWKRQFEQICNHIMESMKLYKETIILVYKSEEVRQEIQKYITNHLQFTLLDLLTFMTASEVLNLKFQNESTKFIILQTYYSTQQQQLNNIITILKGFNAPIQYFRVEGNPQQIVYPKDHQQQIYKQASIDNDDVTQFVFSSKGKIIVYFDIDDRPQQIPQKLNPDQSSQNICPFNPYYYENQPQNTQNNIQKAQEEPKNQPPQNITSKSINNDPLCEDNKLQLEEMSIRIVIKLLPQGEVIDRVGDRRRRKLQYRHKFKIKIGYKSHYP